MTEKRSEGWRGGEKAGRESTCCMCSKGSIFLPLTTTKFTKFRWVDKLVFQSRIIFLTVLWSVASKYSLWINIKPVLNSCLNTVCPASIYSCCCNQSVPREKLKALSQMPGTSLASTQSSHDHLMIWIPAWFHYSLSDEFWFIFHELNIFLLCHCIKQCNYPQYI